MEVVRPLHEEGVGGHVREPLPTVVLTAVVEAYEAGVGVAVVDREPQGGSGVPSHAHLTSEAARASGVGHQAAGGIAVGEDGHLLVAAVDVEEGEVGREHGGREAEVGARFIVPGLFGPVLHDVADIVVSRQAHEAHQTLLEHVGKHLRVESPGLVSLADAGVEVGGFESLQLVEHAYLRQKLEVMVGQASGVVDIHLHVAVRGGVGGNRHHARGIVVDGVGCVAEAAVAHRDVFVIKAQGGGQLPAPRPQARFMVDGRSARGHREVGVEGKRVLVPAYRVMRIDLIAVRLDQMAYAVLLECHGSRHIEMTVESIYARKPGITVLPYRATEHQVLRDGVLRLFLRDREVRVRQEVLVKGHVVVKELERTDRREFQSMRQAGVDRQAVGQQAPAIEARVVVVDLPARHTFIRVSALTQQRARQGVDQSDVGRYYPVYLITEGAVDLDVGLTLVVLVDELSAVAVEAPCKRETQVTAEFPVPSYVELEEIVEPQFGQGAPSLELHRREGAYAYHAGHGVAPEEGALRATHHFQAADVGDVEVVGVLVEYAYIVDGQSHGRLVHAGADAAHVDGGGDARAVIGDIEIGHDSGEAL